MQIPPHRRRLSRPAAVVLSAFALVTLGTAPAALAAEPAPDLVVGNIAPIDGEQPGSTFDVPAVVANNGSGPAAKVWVLYSVTRGLDYADVPSNCSAHQVPSYDEMTAKSNVVCEFDQTVAPGAAYTPQRPLAVRTLGRALNDDLRVSVWDSAPPLDDAATPPVPGTAPAVRLVESPGPAGAAEEAVDVPVTTVNTADYRVSAAGLKGRVGDTVSMKVTFTNAGPGWVLPKETDPLLKVLITPPAGTSVVEPDGYCEARGGAYSCGTGERWVNEGAGQTYTFALKIDKRVPGAHGTAELSSGTRPFDPDKADDRTGIALDVTGGGQPDGSAATPTGGANGATAASAGGSAGASAGGSGGATGGSPLTGDSSSAGGPVSTAAGDTATATMGGSLADTGASGATLPLAGAAAAALALGAGAVLTGRRRRPAGRD